jgi:hypothetical protein
VHRKRAANFEVRSLRAAGRALRSYRSVGRRKDIKEHRRFAKIDTRRLPLLATARAMREPRKPAPTRAGLRAFAARLEKKARERAPKGADKGRARMATKRSRPDLMTPLL